MLGVPNKKGEKCKMKRPVQRRSAALVLPALMMALLVPAAALAGCVSDGEDALFAATGAESPEEMPPEPAQETGEENGALSGTAAPAPDPPEGNYADLSGFSPSGDVEGLADRAGISGYGSDTGYYSFRLREDASASLCYLDYASGREIVLCSQPNCAHDSDACPAWYPFANGLRAVPVGDRLIALQGGSPNYADLLGAQAVPKVEVMEPDGSDRQETFTFPASCWVSTLPRGGFARDDRYLYFTVTDQSAGANARTLCAADGEGNVFALCALPEDEERIAGGDGGALILTCMPGSSDLSGQDYVTQVLRLDLEQMQMTPLLSYPAEALGVCGQGAYYVLDGQTLQGYSLTDGSKLSDVAVDNPGVQTLYGVFDGRLLASGYTWEGEPLCYALDVETGERTDLPYIFREDGTVAFGEILAQAGDRFVCVAGVQSDAVTYPAQSGEEPMRTSWLSPAYALVNFADFWAGSPMQVIPRPVE